MYKECILHFSYVLDRTFFAFDKVNHIPGTTVCGGFNTRPLASDRAVERSARFYMGTMTCLTAWLLTLAITLVCFFSCIHMPPIPRDLYGLGGAEAIGNKGGLDSAPLSRGDIFKTHLWLWRMRVRRGRSGW